MDILVPLRPGWQGDEEWVLTVAGVGPDSVCTEGCDRRLSFSFKSHMEAQSTRDRLSELRIQDMRITLDPEVH